MALSVDCGSIKPYTDNATGICWVPDTEYIKTGTTLRNATASNSLQYQTLRYFQEKQSKFCYKLPATNDTSYLVRATFFNAGMRLKSPSFQVLIDTSTIAVIMPGNSSTWERVVEVIVFPTDGHIESSMCALLPFPMARSSIPLSFATLVLKCIPLCAART